MLLNRKLAIHNYLYNVQPTTLVYDNDLGDPIADGFYFTIGYPGMTSGELAKELMYYGVSAISLVTTGSA